MIRPRLLWQYARHGNPAASMTGGSDTFPMAWWSAWCSAWFTILFALAQFVLPPATWLPVVSRDTWGLVFFVAGLALVVALRSSLTATRTVLRGNGTLFLFYGALYAYSAHAGALAVGAFLLFGYVAVHHLAAAQVLHHSREG